jgi:glycosyltransferase involved in cell wall biosynthesis
MNDGKLILDITTLNNWNRYPVGIVRTLYEFFKHCYINDLATFTIFNDGKDNIIVCSKNDIDKIYYKFENENWDVESSLSIKKSRFEKLVEAIKLGDYYRIAKFVYTKLPSTVKDILRKWVLPIILKRINSDNDFINEKPLLSKIDFIERDISKDVRPPLSENDIFVTIGLDWDYSNYKLIYELKKNIGFKVVTCFYDAIPITHPHLVHSDYFGKIFYIHIYNLINISDKIFCISNFSKKELEKLIIANEFSFNAKLKTIYLGSDIKNKKNCNYLEIKEKYVLYVSTIEARKNHELLVDVWDALVSKYKENAPKLILVGMYGWGIESFQRKLKSNKKLLDFITIKDRVSDEELVELYQNSTFCVFPSLVEGWGLGAAEALSYGKVCLISEAESLSEATQFLMPALPNDKDIWVNEVSKLFYNEQYLKENEEKISSKYLLRTWNDFSQDFYSFVTQDK